MLLNQINSKGSVLCHLKYNNIFNYEFGLFLEKSI